MNKISLPRSPNRLDAIEGSRELDEQFLAMIVSLTSEVTVLRARLDACERLLAKGGALEKGAIESFEPDLQAQTEREGQRRHTMHKVFRPLLEAASKDLQARGKK